MGSGYRPAWFGHWAVCRQLVDCWLAGNFELFLVGAVPGSIAAGVALWLDHTVFRLAPSSVVVPAAMPPYSKARCSCL